jgi:cell division protein FtsQ
MALIATKKMVVKNTPKNLGFARRSKILLRRILLALQLLFLGLIVYFYYFPNVFLKNLITSKMISLSVICNFTLQNVYLEGQNFTKNDAVMKAIDLKIGQPILNISLSELKEKIEAMTWVKRAVISRILPSTLIISIVEKKPIAIWQNLGKLYLIEKDGGVINETNLDPFKNLIVMTGDDAPLNAVKLLQVITSDAELFALVKSAMRVGERRWNVRFKEGLEVKLPEENWQVSWDYVIKLYHNKLLFNGAKLIDLRVQNKLFIKK